MDRGVTSSLLGPALCAGLVALAALHVPAPAQARLNAWTLSACDTPSQFYSATGTGRPMCCSPAAEARPSIGVCPGGQLCPGSGVCASGHSCIQLSHPDAKRPNLLVVYSDDQGYCQFGFMGTCRTDREGTPVPAPYTPTLDGLAARGKVFTVAYNAAHWCLPSRDAVITGRLAPQRGCTGTDCRPPGTRPDGETLGSGSSQSISQLIAGAGPGYCSFQVGKGLQRVGFDAARQSRKTGRAICSRCGGQTAWSSIPASCDFDPLACPDPSDTLNEACYSRPLCAEDDPLSLGFTDVARDGGLDLFLEDMTAFGSDGKQYMPKKFMAWLAPALPHTPTAPSDVVEHRPHSPNISDPSVCRDFLFGYHCTETSPGNVQILGPRFPFGGPAYAPRFGFVPKSKMQGLYGNVWWLDDLVNRARKALARHTVETETGPATVAASTVIMFMSDNGQFLPRSKKQFTENGFRSPLIIYDPRNETGVGQEFRVETDVASAIDIMPTLLAYAGGTTPSDRAGRDLRRWIDTPSPTPVRRALCGTDVKSQNGTAARYLLPRGGAIGQCSAPSAMPCSTDLNCSGAALCAETGSCAVPAPDPCVDDADCAASEVCRFKDRRWCSGSPLHACTNDSQCKATCKTCSKAPSLTCADGFDCGSLGPCVDAPGDKLACTCGVRRVKVYTDLLGAQQRLTDLLSDPDEAGLINNVAAVAGASKLANRLRCCLDQWWLPPGQAAANCPGGCDARVDCTL